MDIFHLGFITINELHRNNTAMADNFVCSPTKAVRIAATNQTYLCD